MKALEAARALREMALLEDLGGGNPFRSRAYEKAARLLEGLGEETDLADLLKEGGIARARGVGAGILAVLEDLARGETPPALE
ncbi:MAG TPA: DNA polymerase/3'-5' exonuclease PolX, partial [Planctomycetes bacterium]|nr:DNA polymerase/3'-5' exonuclease PolX [Planctomycetota bacterium]